MQFQNINFRKYLEICVNISLVVGCLALVGVLAKSYFTSSIPNSKKVKTGDTIFFSDFPWKKGEESLLLFLQSDCQYCTKSANFYSDIAREATHFPDIKIVAVFSEKDARFHNYLKEIGLENIETRQANFAEIGIEGTPTLAVVDEDGSIQNVWKGILSFQKQMEVKEKLGFKITSLFIEESGIDTLRKKGDQVTVVDVRDRDSYALKHFADAKNIPADELYVRAVNELSPSDTVVVYGNFDDEGEDVQEILAKEGFLKIYILRYKSPEQK